MLLWLAYEAMRSLTKSICFQPTQLCPRDPGPAPQFCKIDFVYTCKLTMEFFHFCNGLCYNWQEAITLNSFHIIPFYWVVWSLFSIKDLKEFRNGFFFCPAISFSCRALGGYFSRTPIVSVDEWG